MIDYREATIERADPPEGADFTGLLVKYGVKDAYDTIFAEGCFRADLASDPMRVLLANHERSSPVGALECSDAKDGVRVIGTVNTSIPEGERVKQMVDFNRAHGVKTGLSVGFRSQKGQMDNETWIYTFLQAHVLEGSITMFPAVPGSQIDRSIWAARSVEDLDRLTDGQELNDAEAEAYAQRRLLLADQERIQQTLRSISNTLRGVKA